MSDIHNYPCISVWDYIVEHSARSQCKLAVPLNWLDRIEACETTVDVEDLIEDLRTTKEKLEHGLHKKIACLALAKGRIILDEIGIPTKSFEYSTFFQTIDSWPEEGQLPKKP